MKNLGDTQWIFAKTADRKPIEGVRKPMSYPKIGLTPEQANKFLQEELIPDLKEKIIKAKDSGMNLTEYFNFSNK